MTAPPAPPARSTPARWARVAIDRVPTKWLVTGATGVFLIATAAFGGLADAETPAPPVIAHGETFSSPQLALTLGEAAVIDSLDELYLDVPSGHRAIAVFAQASNAWTRPQLATAAEGGIGEVLALRVGDERAGAGELLAIVRTDDPQVSPMLQPGVAAPLAFIWAVPAASIDAAGQLTVELFTQRLHTGTVTASGQWWTDPALAATMTLPIGERATLTPVAVAVAPDEEPAP